MKSFKNTALAAGLIVAGTFATFEYDRSLTAEMNELALKCYDNASSKEVAESCASDVRQSYGGNLAALEYLEIGSVIGSLAMGYKIVNGFKEEEFSDEGSKDTLAV